MDHTELAFFLVLFSAFMHATWNAVVKAGKNRFHTLATVDGTAFLICLLALPFVSTPSLQVWGYIFISVILNTIYRLLLIKAYEMGDFGQVYPIVRGVPPVLVALFSILLLSETLSGQAYLGVALISIGIINLTVVRALTTEFISPVIISILAGIFIAGYTIVDAIGVRQSGSVYQFIIYLTLFQSIPIPALALIKNSDKFVKHVRNNWMVGALGGLFYLASYGLILYTFTIIAVAEVSALRETSVIIAAIIASVFFKEEFGIRKFMSAVIICLGILLIKIN